MNRHPSFLSFEIGVKININRLIQNFKNTRIQCVLQKIKQEFKQQWKLNQVDFSWIGSVKIS